MEVICYSFHASVRSGNVSLMNINKAINFLLNVILGSLVPLYRTQSPRLSHPYALPHRQSVLMLLHILSCVSIILANSCPAIVLFPYQVIASFPILGAFGITMIASAPVFDGCAWHGFYCTFRCIYWQCYASSDYSWDL